MQRFEESIGQQATSTNEVNATSREISGTVRDLARTMNKVASMADEAGELAGAGIAGLEDIRAAMQDLMDSTADITTQLDTFREKTDLITGGDHHYYPCGRSDQHAFAERHHRGGKSE